MFAAELAFPLWLLHSNPRRPCNRSRRWSGDFWLVTSHMFTIRQSVQSQRGRKWLYQWVMLVKWTHLLNQQSCSKKRDWLLKWKAAEQDYEFYVSFSIVFLFQDFLLILVFLSLHQIWSCGETKYFSFTVRDFLCTAPAAALGETVQQLNHVSNWGQALKLKLNSSWQSGVFYNPFDWY